MCSMVVCVLLPRFELAVAAGGREELARGPVALAPEPGREPLIGEASAAAEAQGVKAGLRLGEALARCPSLRLIAPDPAGVADEWDQGLAALGGMGAEVESERPGVACFDASGLLNLHGGLDGVLSVTHRALRGAPARLPSGPPPPPPHPPAPLRRPGSPGPPRASHHRRSPPCADDAGRTYEQASARRWIRISEI